jgi:hypothetical protein
MAWGSGGLREEGVGCAERRLLTLLEPFHTVHTSGRAVRLGPRRGHRSGGGGGAGSLPLVGEGRGRAFAGPAAGGGRGAEVAGVGQQPPAPAGTGSNEGFWGVEGLWWRV